MTTYYRRHLDDRQVHQCWIDPRLYTVRVADLREYLLRKGWKEVTPDRPGVFVFEEPAASEEGSLYQWFPDSEERRDYSQALYELLAALAEMEDRSAGDVLSDILEPSHRAASSPNGPRTPAQADPVHG